MLCVICNGDLSKEETRVVKQKGVRSLIKASLHRQDNLVDVFNKVSSITLHVSCSKRYIYSKVNSKGELKYLSLTPSKPKKEKKDVNFEYIPITTSEKTCDYNTAFHYIPNKSEDNLQAGITKYLPESNKKHIPILVQVGTSNHSPDEVATLSEVKYSPKTDGPKIEYIPVSTDTGTIEEAIEPTLEYLTKCPPGYKDEDNDYESKPFPFQHKCFFCKKDIGDDFKKRQSKLPVKRRNAVYRISEKTQQTILNRLSQSFTPQGEAVLQRIKDVNLLEVGAGYHKNCYLKMYRQKWDSTKKSSVKQAGRPLTIQMQNAMETISRYIEESDRTTFTLTELKSLCKEYQPELRTIKVRLSKIYGEKIYFNSITGRGTICTIIKNASDVISQLQTVNGIELPQVQKKKENKKRTKVKKNKSAKTKEANAQVGETKKEDSSKELSIKKQDDDDFINKDDDDDDGFFADWLDPFPNEFTDEVHEENSKGNRSSLICRICLSSDRKLSALGDYSDIYRSICLDTIGYTDSKQFLLCWECKALLRNVKQFQRKIKTAQKLWNNKNELKCLSTLSITSPFTSVSYTPDNQNSDIFVEIEPFIKPDTENMEIKPEYLDLEKLSPDHNIEEFQGKQENTDFDTFDNTRDDLNSDSSEDTDRPRRKLRRRTTNEAKKKNCDERVNDVVLPPEKDSDTSSTEISDWEPESRRSQSSKKKQSDQQKIKIPYTIIDLNYEASKKMKRVAIPPHELDHWRERERNSFYFESLKGNKCLTCLSEVAENHDKVFHSKTHPHICSVCESSFSTEEDLHAHIENHYYIYSCNICGYQCYNEQHMCDHADRHRTVVQCLECFAIKDTLDILKEHFDEIHRNSQCDYCGKRFRHKMFLEQHIQSNHVPLECTICHINFSTYTKKYTHMKMKHLIERTEAAYCVQCDKQFDNEALLKRHISSSTKHASEWKREPKKYKPQKPKEKQQLKCPECPNVYASKSSLNAHVDLVHKHIVKYYCNDCQKAFPLKSGYDNHMRVKHQGYKLPKNKFCHICGRGFSIRKTLVHHIRTHTGERPHACALCAARFAQKAALNSHVKHIHQKMSGPTH